MATKNFHKTIAIPTAQLTRAYEQARALGLEVREINDSMKVVGAEIVLSRRYSGEDNIYVEIDIAGMERLKSTLEFLLRRASG